MISDKKGSSSDWKKLTGVDLRCSDGEKTLPIITDLTEASAQEWFLSFPHEDLVVANRLLVAKLNYLDASRSDFTVPFSSEIVDHALWSSAAYRSLASNAGGGAVGLLNDYRFILQTPKDGGPLYSMALSKRGIFVKGIVVYDDEDFDPAVIAQGERSMSGWRSTGLQIVNMPQAFLRAHCQFVSGELNSLSERLARIETKLTESDQIDFRLVTRQLQSCSERLLFVHRRTQFEQAVVSAIETIVLGERHGRLPWSDIAPQKTAIESRKFDLESIPRRIKSARATIASLIQQQNEATNLEIAEATRRMTELALRDNASMKTIAIMTMIFLPGTAVASFFSINMFNWESGDGGGLASHWVWIYFVVTVPLTGFVVLAWWFWSRQAVDRVLAGHASTRNLRRYEDHDRRDTLELETLRPNTAK